MRRAPGGRTISGTRRLPPRANFQELIVLPRSFHPRRLWIRDGLGIDAEVLVMKPGPRRRLPIPVPQWRTFDEVGNITMGLEVRGRPRALLLVWASQTHWQCVIDWELSEVPFPRPVLPLLDTATGEHFSGFELAIAAAFDVGPGMVRQVGEDAADGCGVDRRGLLRWLDRMPWSDVEGAYRQIRAEVAKAPLPPRLSVDRAALALWYSWAARAMKQRS